MGYYHVPTILMSAVPVPVQVALIPLELDASIKRLSNACRAYPLLALVIPVSNVHPMNAVAGPKLVILNPVANVLAGNVCCAPCPCLFDMLYTAYL